jgi:hypothetical protein
MQPHLPVVDYRHEPTGVIALTGPLGTVHAQAVHAQLRGSGRLLVGFASHGWFPVADEAMANRYVRECAGWCHCFRNDTGFGPAPLLALSHSDLLDVDYVNPRTFAQPRKQFDYAFVCLAGRAAEEAKGWSLAKETVLELTRAGLKGLLIGRVVVRDLPPAADVVVRGRLRWPDFLRSLASCRSLLVTSVGDASPRTLAEALALDVPVVVNSEIAGGWKYVNHSTGAFFTGKHDVADAMNGILGSSLSPRDWYCESFGVARSGARLRDFLNALGARLPGPYVTLGHVPSFDWA